VGIVAALLVVPLVLFTLAAVGVGGKINLQSAGLACLTLALMVSRGAL
jgi:hypothetical protein